VHYEGDAGWLATLAHLRAAFVIVPFVEGRADILRTSLSAARATGGCVLVTKLESAASLAAAREAAADLFQGLGLAGPGPDPIDSGREETGSTGTLPADRN
jgi:EAL domain-containing protein (putative c-di-GMP-specific phosphodiesterase class I)